MELVFAAKESMLAVQEVRLQIDTAYTYLVGFIVWVDDKTADDPLTNNSATPIPDPETNLNSTQYQVLAETVTDEAGHPDEVDKRNYF